RTAMPGGSTTISQLELNADLVARMRTPRAFAELGASTVVAAQGGVLASPVQLRIELQAGAIDGESKEYHFELYRANEALLEVRAHPLPDNPAQLEGRWRASLAAPDLAPF